MALSREPWEIADSADAEWCSEASGIWPCSSDFQECGCSAGWLFQQVLKLYARVVVPDLAASVLVCDADVVWLRETFPL